MPIFDELLRAERDQNADDDDPHLANERAPAVHGFGEVDVHQPILPAGFRTGARIARQSAGSGAGQVAAQRGLMPKSAAFLRELSAFWVSRWSRNRARVMRPCSRIKSRWSRPVAPSNSDSSSQAARSSSRCTSLFENSS